MPLDFSSSVIVIYFWRGGKFSFTSPFNLSLEGIHAALEFLSTGLEESSFVFNFISQVAATGLPHFFFY